MNLVVDKADNLKVVDSDTHFSEFAGVHPSKIKQGKLFLHDLIVPVYREEIMKALCKKHSPYVYFNAEFIDKNSNPVYIHCTGQNFKNSSYCRLTLADISKFRTKQQKLKDQAREMNYLIDLVAGGVCLFRVTSDMHLETLFLNEGACRLFGTTKNSYKKHIYRFDEIIHPDDKSDVFQAIGNAMATDKEVEIEIRIITQNTDEIRWCKFNAAIQKYDEDNTPVFHAMFTDITKLKETEEKTDRFNDTLVELFRNLPDPIFCTSADDVLGLNIVSDEFVKFLGFSREYLLEEHNGRLDDFIAEREVKFVEATIKNQLEKDDSTFVRYSVRTKSGKYVVVEDKRKLVKDENGILSLMGRLKNVTKKYEKYL